jgi:hypothetical protein
VAGALYRKLASQKGIGDGPRYERAATIFEIERACETVLQEFRVRPGLWILWIDVDDAGRAACGKHRGRQLQFVFLEDGTSVIGECRSNTLLDEEYQLTAEQEVALRALGWRDEAQPWTPNWHFEATSVDDLMTLGRMTQRTLHEVFGLTDRDRAVAGFRRRFTGPKTA